MTTSFPFFINSLTAGIAAWFSLYWTRILLALFIFVIFYLLSLLAKILTKRDVDISLYKKPSPEAIKQYNRTSKKVFYGSILQIVFLGLGVVLALLSTGIDTVGLFSGVGIVGVLLTYSLTDVIREYYAGFIILSQEPFNIGEQVEIDNVRGVVKTINPRHTIIRDYHEHDVVIPNTKIVDGSIHITPVTALQRDSFRISVPYKSDVKKAIEAGEQALRNTAGVSLSVAPRGYVREIGYSNILAFYYTIPGARREQFNVRNIALQNVLKALQEAKIETSDTLVPPEFYGTR